MAYGVCRVCGCTDQDPCYNPEYGNCWWVDDSHELCSHCADAEIANHPGTQHCINSEGIDPFPGVVHKDLAAIGCPYPDEDISACADCSHRSILFGTCDLGIEIC